MTDISRRHLMQTAAGLAALASAQPAMAQSARGGGNIRARLGLHPDLIYVNAANLCGTFLSASAAERAASMDVQGDPSQEYRRKFVETSATLRGRFAKMLNTSQDAIALTRNSSESSGIIGRGVVLKAGDEVILGKENHPSNTNYWLRRQKMDGIVVKTAQVPDEPKTPQEVLDSYISLATPRTKVIALSHMTNIGGIIAPAAEIGRFARSRNIWFHLDCAQTFGWMQLDPAKLGCDSFSGSTHKWMMGPLGGGVLYVRPERIAELNPLIMSVDYYHSGKNTDVNGQAFEYVGQRADEMLDGLMAALDERESIGEANIERMARDNARIAREKLTAKGLKIIGSGDPATWGPCLAVAVNDLQNRRADLYKVHKVVGSTSHINGQTLFRASPHCYNTADELDRLATLLA